MREWVVVVVVGWWLKVKEWGVRWSGGVVVVVVVVVVVMVVGGVVMVVRV
jgi:hypothetical protein